METLWAPWRMAYLNRDVAGGHESGAGEQPAPADAPPDPAAPACIFCAAAAADPSHDRAHLLLHRGTRAFVILNRYPYNSGHLMIVPYRHLADVTALTPAENGELLALLQRMVALLGRVYHPEGFNAGMNLGAVAGAGIADHLHLHLVPRWSGDTNFMPVVGQTKVLPESLEQTYDRLAAVQSGTGDKGQGTDTADDRR